MKRRLITLGIGYTIALAIALIFFAGSGARLASAHDGTDWCYVPIVDTPEYDRVMTDQFEPGWGEGTTWPHGPAPCAPVACPAPYHMGSSGCQTEPWLPDWIEDRGQSHTPTATSSTNSAQWPTINYVPSGAWIPAEVTL